MASTFPAAISNASIFSHAFESEKEIFRRIYSEHCHRIYSLAFWMTDHELVAEQVAAKTFLRAFAAGSRSAEEIDQAFLSEIRELVPVDGLTLRCEIAARTGAVNRNVRRCDLEGALVQLPAMEKMIFLLHDVEGYEHYRIARLLDITHNDSRFGLHQARLRIRELLGQIQ